MAQPTKIFMHFSTTSPALFGRIQLLDCAGPIETLTAAYHRSSFICRTSP
jgi:hypothetical protein